MATMINWYSRFPIKHEFITITTITMNLIFFAWNWYQYERNIM